MYGQPYASPLAGKALPFDPRRRGLRRRLPAGGSPGLKAKRRTPGVSSKSFGAKKWVRRSPEQALRSPGAAHGAGRNRHRP